MEMPSALLFLCVGNPLVTTDMFVFSLNKLFNNKSCSWWFSMAQCSCDITVMSFRSKPWWCILYFRSYRWVSDILASGLRRMLWLVPCSVQNFIHNWLKNLICMWHHCNAFINTYIDTPELPYNLISMILYKIGLLRGYAIRSGRRPEGSQRPQGGPQDRLASDFPRDVCLTVSRNHAVFLLSSTNI